MQMPRYRLQPTARFKRNVKVLKKRGYDMSLLEDVVSKLANGETLPKQYLDHPLKGDKNGYRDCHIQNDWLLIYKLEKEILRLVLSETGTHSDLF